MLRGGGVWRLAVVKAVHYLHAVLLVQQVASVCAEPVMLCMLSPERRGGDARHRLHTTHCSLRFPDTFSFRYLPYSKPYIQVW